jgi:hypothetical protein
MAEQDKRASNSFETIGGKGYIISPITLLDMELIEDAALKQWKKRTLDAYKENQEMYLTMMTPDELRAECLKVGSMGIDDIPQRMMQLAARDDDGNLVYEGDPPKIKIIEILVDYAGWWASKTPRGMVMSCWLSLKKHQPEVTLEIADSLFRDDAGQLMKEDLERISEQVGKASRTNRGDKKKD